MSATRTMVVVVLVAGAVSQLATAQVPAGGAAGGTAAAAPGGAAGAAVAGEAKPGFLKKACAEIKECCALLCKTPAGQMLNKITLPVSTLTGGIIPSFCPGVPTPNELKKPGAEGAAANAMADAAAAPARKAAVRTLSTFDCHWFPEAEVALITALRADRNECVRLEAAWALSRGCCCTNATIKALIVSVNGDDTDNNPSENSPRVRQAAAIALARCCSCPVTAEPAPEAVDTKTKKPEDDDVEKGQKGKVTPKPTEVETGPAPRKLPDEDDDQPAKAKPLSAKAAGPKPLAKPTHATMVEARRAVANYRAQHPTTQPNQQTAGVSESRSLFQVIGRAIDGPSAPTMMAATPMPPLAPTTVVAAPRPLPMHVPAETNGPILGTPVSTGPTIDPTVRRCLHTIRDAADVNERHTAVRTLAACDWHDHPEALAGLVHVARTDKEPALRVASLRYLTQMKANTPLVVTSLQPMTADPDDWVSDEANRALARLKTLPVSR